MGQGWETLAESERSVVARRSGGHLPESKTDPDGRRNTSRVPQQEQGPVSVVQQEGRGGSRRKHQLTQRSRAVTVWVKQEGGRGDSEGDASRCTSVSVRFGGVPRGVEQERVSRSAHGCPGSPGAQAHGQAEHAVQREPGHSGRRTWSAERGGLRSGPETGT